MNAVDAWLRWLPTWAPGTHRGRSRICRRCVGSPVVAAAGFSADAPHQVVHALVSRMQRIVDRQVDEFTERELPHLFAELTDANVWTPGGYDPAGGLDPEYDGLDLDPEPDEQAQPFLFTMQGLAETNPVEPALPRPPLRPEEKAHLRAEIDRADQCAVSVGSGVCFALTQHRSRIVAAVTRFVEPQIIAMIDDLSNQLEAPR
jgi:hypothetical protein